MRKPLIITGMYFLWMLANTSCKHEPLFDDDTGGGIPIDTTINPVVAEHPCSPDTVYFQYDVMPILISNCAMTGCHNAASAKDGVILDSYANVMATADVRPFNPGKSDLYEVLVEDKPSKRMPYNLPPLPEQQIQLIAKWIAQGAKNLNCDPDAGQCDTTSVSYSQHLVPVIDAHCKGCHSGASPSGGINLSTYQGVKTVALNGKLYGAISWSNGFSKMPQGGVKLPDCTIAKFKAWMEGGAKEN